MARNRSQAVLDALEDDDVIDGEAVVNHALDVGDEEEMFDRDEVDAFYKSLPTEQRYDQTQDLAEAFGRYAQKRYTGNRKVRFSSVLSGWKQSRKSVSPEMQVDPSTGTRDQISAALREACKKVWERITKAS